MIRASGAPRRAPSVVGGYDLRVSSTPYPPPMRASDDDRAGVEAVLSQAYTEGRLDRAEFEERTSKLWQCRYLSDFDALVADLPATVSPSGPPILATRPAPAPERTADHATGIPLTLSLMGGSTRQGDWTCGQVHVAATTMGGIKIDLRDARFAAPVTRIVCFALMGGITVIAPDDIHVRSSGIGVMGGFGGDPEDDAPSQAGPSAPEVVITGVALMGGVGIRRVSRSEPI